jgi:hypothetical protein
MHFYEKMILNVAGFLLLCLLLIPGASAQTPLEVKNADKLFSGFWIDRKTTRHLSINIEKDGYVVVNDWTSKYQKQESGDAYKAYIKGEKLIMPLDNEHHAPYAEMQIVDKKLVYITKFKDVKGKLMVGKELFVRRGYGEKN